MPSCQNSRSERGSIQFPKLLPSQWSCGDIGSFTFAPTGKGQKEPEQCKVRSLYEFLCLPFGELQFGGTMLEIITLLFFHKQTVQCPSPTWGSDLLFFDAILTKPGSRCAVVFKHLQTHRLIFRKQVLCLAYLLSSDKGSVIVHIAPHSKDVINGVDAS